MSDWYEQYSAALDQRDAREQAHKAYIDACMFLQHVRCGYCTNREHSDTKLADRTAGLEAREATPVQLPASPAPSTKAVERTGTPTRSKTAPPQEPESSPIDALSRIRADLATTQKARSALQAQVEELSASLKTLQLQSRTSATQIAQLTRQKTDVERRLRDRDEELRGKTKLAEDAQDEMVALGLQLNISEQKAEKLKVENEDLVQRWMKRMGEEAEKVNRDSNWGS